MANYPKGYFNVSSTGHCPSCGIEHVPADHRISNLAAQTRAEAYAKRSHGSGEVSDERNGSQQASPDLLETERERMWDLVEKEVVGENELVEVTDWDCPCGVRHHDVTDPHQANQLRAKQREVIERLRRSSLRINPTVPTEAKHGKGEPTA